MKIDVLGRDWKISVLDADQFEKRFGSVDAGITTPETKEIVICADDVFVTTIAHELTHAFYDSLCISSAHLKRDQIEEVFCELLAVHGETILKMAKGICKALQDKAS